MYPRVAERADRRGAAAHRRRLVDGLAGRVVEVGAGNGRNLPHYPATVTELIAIEPEPTLRALAAAQPASVPVTVVDGMAEELPFADAELDAAVVSLVLCSVDDQARALAELHRVVRPGGELRFYEHVIAHRQPKRALFRLADRTGAWPKLAAGCHLARDTLTAIAAAGFTIEAAQRIDFRSAPLEPKIPYVLGRGIRATRTSA
jgi:SAM-dependent methyltransferase